MADVVLSPKQEQAVRAILAWFKGGAKTPQVYYLAGYAGTGKSTIFRVVIETLKAHAGLKDHALATYTGKAANVLRQKGNRAARTLHSGCYMPAEGPDGKVTFMWSPEAPFSTVGLIGVDEGSMVGDELGEDVERFGVKILVMGDPGQLQPISGKPRWTNREPDFFLDEIHRQAADSPILRLATAARLNQAIPLGEWADSEGNISRVLAHGSETQRELYREDTQAICGVHRVRWGYTQRIRRARGFEGEFPMAGETILSCKNDRELGIFNGSVGVLESPVEPYRRRDGDFSETVVTFDRVAMEDLRRPLIQTKVNPYLFAQHFDPEIKRPRIYKGIHEFDWGYVWTCHKAQGSEWDDVTIVDDGGAFRQDCNRWRYTALTRAAKRVTFLRRM